MRAVKGLLAATLVAALVGCRSQPADTNVTGPWQQVVCVSLDGSTSTSEEHHNWTLDINQKAYEASDYGGYWFTPRYGDKCAVNNIEVVK